MGRPRKGPKVVTFPVATVDVPLDDKQQAVKARELATLCDTIDAARAAAKADGALHRKKIRALEDERRLLAECVRTGTEKQNAQADLFKQPRKTSDPAPEHDLEADDLDSALLGEAEAAFNAPAPTNGIVDERDAFLANKNATTPPKAWAEVDADKNEMLGQIVERESSARRSTTTEPRAGGFGPSSDATQSGKGSGGSTTTPRASSASEFVDVGDGLDVWDDMPAGETPAATPKAKRKAKNGTKDDGPAVA